MPFTVWCIWWASVVDGGVLFVFLVYHVWLIQPSWVQCKFFKNIVPRALHLVLYLLRLVDAWARKHLLSKKKKKG